MNPTKILDEFKKIYPELHDVKIKYFSHDKFVGCCSSTTIGEFVYEGKFRYQHIKPETIKITNNDKKIIWTLLHEISHAITPYYERKVKDEWIKMDHSDKFYKNFYNVVNHAYSLKILDRVYSLAEIKKLDKL